MSDFLLLLSDLLDAFIDFSVLLELLTFLFKFDILILRLS